jgi:hypothetical protein
MHVGDSLTGQTFTEKEKVQRSLIIIYFYAYTVKEKSIWSPADFVRLLTDKEMISLSF